MQKFIIKKENQTTFSHKGNCLLPKAEINFYISRKERNVYSTLHLFSCLNLELILFIDNSEFYLIKHNPIRPYLSTKLKQIYILPSFSQKYWDLIVLVKTFKFWPEPMVIQSPNPTQQKGNTLFHMRLLFTYSQLIFLFSTSPLQPLPVNLTC